MRVIFDANQWAEFERIADTFKTKAVYQDRADLRGDILVRLAELATRRGEMLTLPAMLRIAAYVCQEYWHKMKRQPSTLYLSYELQDDEGYTIELGDTLADDKAIDTEAWLDARRWLLGAPRRLVQVANRTYHGFKLSHADEQYLYKVRKRELRKYQLSFN